MEIRILDNFTLLVLFPQTTVCVFGEININCDEMKWRCI